MMRAGLALAFAALIGTASAANAARSPTWTTAVEPFEIYGNTYYVGTEGIASVLITSPQGHVLVDAGVADAAPLVAASIRKLGFDVHDVKAIVASHAHHDHVGGIAELRRLSGATVYARAAQAATLRVGELQPDDPQYGVADSAFPAVEQVSVIPDDGAVKVGSIVLHAIATPGHTPGGTSWTWQSCEHERCASLVYADSLTAVSADGFRFTQNTDLVDELSASIDRIASEPCDVLVTPHPEVSRFFERMQERAEGGPTRVIDTGACRRYADGARAGLASRLQRERDGREN